MCLRGANFIVIVFDVTEASSVVGLDALVDLVTKEFGESPPMVVFCGNKIDLVGPQYDRNAMIDSLNERFGVKLPCMRVLFTSAVTGEGIDKIFPTLFGDDPDVLFEYCSNDNVQ